MKALYEVQSISSSTKGKEILKRFGIIYIILDLSTLALLLLHITAASNSPEFIFCHELAQVTVTILTNMVFGDTAAKDHVITCHGFIDLVARNLSTKNKKVESLIILLCNLLKNIFHAGSPSGSFSKIFNFA